MFNMSLKLNVVMTAIRFTRVLLCWHSALVRICVSRGDLKIRICYTKLSSEGLCSQKDGQYLTTITIQIGWKGRRNNNVPVFQCVSEVLKGFRLGSLKVFQGISLA